MSRAEWSRSSHCSTGACVEVRRVGQVVQVQDSKLPLSIGGFAQDWSAPEWSGLLAAIRANAAHPAVDVMPGGSVWLGFQHSGRHEILRFDLDEWSTFVAGVKDGEFDFDKLSGPAAAMGVGAGRTAGPDGTGRPSEVATGAGAAGNPAPVAADVLGPPPVKPPNCENPEASLGQDPPSELPTGSRVLPGAAHTHFSGPNVAALNVPAGQPSSVSTAQVSPPQEAGQPGPFATNTDVDLVRPDFLTGVDVEEWAREWAESAWAIGFAAGRQATTSEVDEAREWARRTAPLVPPEPAFRVTDVVDCDCYQCSRMRNEASRGGGTAEATGGALPDRAGVFGGKAGPGSHPRAPGPADTTGGAS